MTAQIDAAQGRQTGGHKGRTNGRVDFKPLTNASKGLILTVS